jgi:hypothetical protein
MEVALYIVGAIGVLMLLSRLGSKETGDKPKDLLNDDRDHDATTLHEKWHAPGHHKDILDRHFKLQEGVQQAYKDRGKSSKNRDRFVKLAMEHISAFPSIRPVLIEWGMDYAPEKLENESDYLVQVTTFKQLADVLASDGQAERAVEVCEQAIGFGLKDGTKSCFTGRISRIQRQAQQPQSNL